MKVNNQPADWIEHFGYIYLTKKGEKKTKYSLQLGRNGIFASPEPDPDIGFLYPAGSGYRIIQKSIRPDPDSAFSREKCRDF